jgi:O-antigen/teichoic acid export membrane protein
MITLFRIPASLAQQYGLAILQGQRRFTAFNLLRLPAVLYAALIAAVFVFHIGSLPLVAACWVAANGLAGASALLAALRKLSPPSAVAAEPLRSVVKFGLKGMLGSISPLESFRLDQVVVGLFLSPVALGLYVAGLAFTNLPYFVAQSVGMVPYVAAEQDERAARSSLWRFFWFTMAICTLVVVGLEILAGWLVLFFFGPEFEGAIVLTRILLINALCVCARRVLSDGARGAGHPALGTVAEIISWVVLGLGLIALAPLLGVRGVAFALTLSSFVSLGYLTIAVLVRGRPRPLRVHRSASDEVVFADGR